MKLKAMTEDQFARLKKGDEVTHRNGKVYKVLEDVVHKKYGPGNTAWCKGEGVLAVIPFSRSVLAYRPRVRKQISRIRRKFKRLHLKLSDG